MRLFQITEDDLAELERSLPQLMLRLYPSMDNSLRAQVRRLQRIMTDVRWDYGPPGEVVVIPAGPDQSAG